MTIARRPADHATRPVACGPGRRRAGGEDGAAQLVQLVLVFPLLGLLMMTLLHLGLYLMTRQAVITATAEAVKAATVHGATPTVVGPDRVRQVLTDHSPATAIAVATTVDDLAGTVTVTVTADAPAVVPALPRTITVAQTGTHERWLP